MENLENKTYQQLKTLAKDAGINAQQKKDALIEQLKALETPQIELPESVTEELPEVTVTINEEVIEGVEEETIDVKPVSAILTYEGVKKDTLIVTYSDEAVKTYVTEESINDAIDDLDNQIDITVKGYEEPIVEVSDALALINKGIISKIGKTVNTDKLMTDFDKQEGLDTDNKILQWALKGILVDKYI